MNVTRGFEMNGEVTRWGDSVGGDVVGKDALWETVIRKEVVDVCGYCVEYEYEWWEETKDDVEGVFSGHRVGGRMSWPSWW